MLTDDEIDRLQAICDAATEGPLKVYATERYSNPCGSIFGTSSILYHIGTDRDDEAVVGKGRISQSDARFHVAARTAIPRLLEEVRGLRAKAKESEVSDE